MSQQLVLCALDVCLRMLPLLVPQEVEHVC
jgi:hypothetical protein